MGFYVVYLKCKRHVVMKREWIENPVVGQVSKVFISADTSLNADFNVEKSFCLVEKNMCYDGFVEKMYENLEPAHRFIEKNGRMPQFSTTLVKNLQLIIVKL